MVNLIQKIMLMNRILKKIQEGIDVFDRGFTLKKINIDDSYPEYIVNNQKLLKDWIIP